MNDILYYIWSDNSNLDVMCETSVCIVYMGMIENAPMAYISKLDLEVYEN